MKGARRTRHRQGAGFADLMAVPPQPRRGVITGMSRLQQQSNTNTPTATAQTTPSSSTPSTPRPSPADEDWDSLLNISPRRRISPVKSTLGSRSRPGSTSMDSIPPRTPKVSSLKLSSSRQSMPPMTSPVRAKPIEPPQPPPTSQREETKPTESAKSTPTPVPSFLAGWEGNDGWGDDPLDDSDPEIDDEAWGGWGDTTDVSIPESTTDPVVSEVAPTPTPQPNASPILMDPEPQTVDVAKQSEDVYNVEAHSAMSQTPREQSTPVYLETAVAVENRLQHQSEEKDIDHDARTNDSSSRKAEDLGLPVKCAESDGTWRQSEDFDSSSQPPTSVPEATANVDEPVKQSPPVKQPVQPDANRLQDVIDPFSEFGATTPVLENEPEVLGELPTERVNDFITRKDYVNKKSDVRNEFHDANVPVDAREHEGHLCEFRERGGDNAIKDGAWREREELESTLVTVMDTSASMRAAEKDNEPQSLEAIDETTLTSATEDGGTNTCVSFHLNDEVRRIDRIPMSSRETVVSEGKKQVEVAESDRLHSEKLNVGYEDKVDDDEPLHPKEEVGEEVADESAWGEWANIVDFPSEENSIHIMSGEASRNLKQLAPNELTVQMEQETRTRLLIGGDAHGDFSERREAESSSGDKVQFSKPEEGEISTPVPTPSLSGMNVDENRRQDQMDIVNAFDDTIERTGDQWAEWGTFEDFPVPCEDEEALSTQCTGDQQHDLASDAKLIASDECSEETLKTDAEQYFKIPSDSNAVKQETKSEIEICSESQHGVLKQSGNSKGEETTTQSSPSEPEVGFLEHLVAEENDGEAVVHQEEQCTKPHLGVVNRKDINFEVEASKADASVNDGFGVGDEGCWDQRDDFGDISFPSDGNILSIEQEKHDHSHQSVQNFNITKASSEMVCTAESESKFLVEEEAEKHTQNCSSTEPPQVVGIGSQSGTTPRTRDNENEPVLEDSGVWNPSTPQLTNEGQELATRASSDVWKGWDGAQVIPVPEENVVGGPVPNPNSSESLIRPAAFRDPSCSNEHALGIQENVSVNIVDKRAVDEAFFGVPDEEREGAEPTPFTDAGKPGDDEDIWGVWELPADERDHRELEAKTHSEEKNASSLSSNATSKQHEGLFGNPETSAKQGIHWGMSQPTESSKRGQEDYNTVLSESHVAMRDSFDFHNAKRGDDSTSADLKESFNENKTQVAFSTSYWTDKLYSSVAQEQEVKENSLYPTSGAKAETVSDSQHIAAELNSKISAVRELEGQNANYDPFSPAGEKGSSILPCFDEFDITRTSLDETAWYQEDPENIETAKKRSETEQATYPNGNFAPFENTSQSAGGMRNSTPEISDVGRHTHLDQLQEAPVDVLLTPSETYEAFQPTPKVEETYLHPQVAAFEAEDEEMRAQNNSLHQNVSITKSEELLGPATGTLVGDEELNRAEDYGTHHEFSTLYPQAEPSESEEKTSTHKQFSEAEIHSHHEIMETGDKDVQVLSTLPVCEHDSTADNVLNEVTQDVSMFCDPHEQVSGSSHPGVDKSQLNSTCIATDASSPPVATNGADDIGGESSASAAAHAITSTQTFADGFEISSYAPKTFDKSNEAGEDLESSRLRASEHASHETGDLNHVEESYQSKPPGTPGFADESDFQVYAPRFGQVPSSFTQKPEDSQTPMGHEAASVHPPDGVTLFSEDVTPATRLAANESQLGISKPTQFSSTMTDIPEVHADPDRTLPDASSLPHTFEPQRDLPSTSDGQYSGANYAPRQNFPGIPTEYGVEGSMHASEPYRALPQQQELSSQKANDSYVYNEPNTTTAYRPAPIRSSAFSWEQGAVGPQNAETSMEDNVPVSNESHTAEFDLQSYKPVQSDSFHGYEDSSKLDQRGGLFSLESAVPNALAYDEYGNYMTSTPAISEAQKDSTYLDPSLFSYPFSIMDTNPSGDMIHPGSRPIISWSFAGSFVTVFPRSQGGQLDNSTQSNEGDSGHCVQLFDMSPLGADGISDDWIAASAAVEPLSYPVEASKLEPYAKMCDELSQFSVGLSTPAAESRAALWRVLGLLCRTRGLEWRRSAGQAVFGPTSVPLFGSKTQVSTALKQMDEPLSGSLSRIPEGGERDATNEVERLLTEGKGIDAVNRARSAGLWSLALVLAGMIDKKLYMSVLCDFAKLALHEGSALQTLCLSLSENDSEITRRIISPVGLTEWRKNVGMLLTSATSITDDKEKSKRFMSLIDKVGDALIAQNDDIVGSHVCYLVSGRLDTLDREKICILGANPSIPPGRPKSFGSSAAILQSVVFEATLNARTGKTCPHLLPFRLLLALEIASVGRVEVALAHCNSISKEVRAIFESGNSIAAQLFTPPFLSCLESFEQQLRTHLGVQEKGEKLTRLSALGKSLTSVFARSRKDMNGTQAPQEENQGVLPGSQSFASTPPRGLGYLYPSSDHNQTKQPPHLSIDSQATYAFNPAQVSQFSNQSSEALDHSGRKEKSGKEKLNYFVQKTVGLIAPADYDLSPPPASRVPPPAFIGQGEPSAFGLDGGSGTRASGQTLVPSHVKSASVGALPNEFLNSSQFDGNSEVTTGQRIQAFEDGRHTSTPQLESSFRKTEQAFFNGVPVQKATREQKNDALVHRRSASDMTLQSQTSEKKPPLHPKKPTRAPKQTDTSTEKSQPKKGWRERLREKLTAAFSGPPKANMGQENKFVFDKQRGRWVIEGEDPEEEEDVPPPPPDDDNMFGSEGGNVQNSASYDLLPGHMGTGQDGTVLMRSHSAQDARDMNSSNISNSFEQVSAPFNPLSSYPSSLDNSIGGDEGSATSVASAASAPVPYSVAPSFTTSSVGSNNKYRAGGGRRSNRRAYVDTFNKGRPASATSAIPTPTRPAVPALGGITSAGGGYKIFTPTPAPSVSTGNSNTAQGANSSASVVETSDQMTTGSEASSTQHAPTTGSSHSDALPPKPPSFSPSLGLGRQPRMMA
eukprot:TRINITY_DN55512_c0_g1_i1.p1 TRINITY_DN55512_c0_g1~~TRINITY_DN55512_c0_g1_i1.p1  ORF type:complete len:2948 (-),score=434.06 TRINITY_DN55512_c0_g1_i1:108-8951(-)